MSKCRVRLEAKRFSLQSNRQHILIMLRTFKKMCSEYFQRELKDREYFQRKCDIRRRKRMQKKLMARLGGVFPSKGEQPDE